MQRSTLLEYKNYRYFKIASLLMISAVSAYLFDQPAMGAYGGSWLGYMFGIFAALVVLATLHTGFQFGWNVHTLAYALMMVVIISGCYGVYAYLRMPRLMTANMGGINTFDALLLEIYDLDKQASGKSLQFSDDICAIVRKARQETLIGGHFFRQLTAYQRDCPTAKAVQQLQILGKSLKYDQLKSFDDLFLIMAHKEILVRRARRDVMYRARLEFWLYLHAPLSSAFMAALIAPIVAIFFY